MSTTRGYVDLYWQPPTRRRATADVIRDVVTLLPKARP